LINFYWALNFDVLLWNYRGYGSKGTPTPDLLVKDAEAVLDYVTKEYPAHSILLHGHSLGGAVVAKMRKNSNVHMIICDWTFSSLYQAGHYMVGSFLSNVFTYFTFNKWGMETVDGFLKSTQYKILTCDPLDEVIHELASLKVGISNQVNESMLLNSK